MLPSVAVLYASYRYGWDEWTLGLSLAAVGVASGLVQGFLIQPAIRLLGERTALVAGLFFGAAGFAIYGLAETGAWFMAGIPVMALWGIAGAATMGIMSRLVSPSEQGQLQGANSSLMALGSLFGPGLFSFTFAWAIAPGQAWDVPGAPFLLAATVLVAGHGVGLDRYPIPIRRSPDIGLRRLTVAISTHEPDFPPASRLHERKAKTAITPEVVAEHGLKPDEYQRLLDILGREPSLTELGIFSVMWSEHCSYKSTRVWLKSCPPRARR